MSGYLYNVAGVFSNIVEAHGARPALVWPEGVVTFAELDRLSNQAAHFLARQGVARGDRVCIRLDKSTLAYSFLLGCLKLGAPYFVVDPANPVARVSHILAKCMPKLVISTSEPPRDLVHDCVIPVDPANPLPVLQGMPDAPCELPGDVTGADPAYIMFTSGSTGFPKGAVMSHGNLLNFIQWVRQEFSVTVNDVFTSVNPLYFDNSVFDFYGSILNGASLAPFDSATIRDPYTLLRRIDELRCTIYFSVPSLLIYFQTLRILSPQAFARVRAIVFGGEGYPKTKLKELWESFHGRAELVNVYGPTECTCICSAYRVTEADFADLDGYPPLGGPISNFSFLVLNEAGRGVPDGETGELYLGGPCVGLGYFNDPELTEGAFLQNPLNRYYHDRVYRTGDLVRVSPRDGKVHFVGRKDNQIKHQGYRIELGEIEHALCRISGIDEAVALHAVRDGVSVIIGVVASRGGVAPEMIRREAARMLPAYMVPGRVDVLDRLPKNANGKIDRKLLQTSYC